MRKKVIAVATALVLGMATMATGTVAFAHGGGAEATVVAVAEEVTAGDLAVEVAGLAVAASAAMVSQ